jgi:hypothetical protein
MILLILFLFFGGKHVPVVPADALHLGTANVVCMECHAPGKQMPLKPRHPLRDSCLDCHKTKKAAIASPEKHT